MDVTLPNGTVIKDVPMTASKEAIKQKAIAAGLATEADFAPSATQGKPTTRDNMELFKESLKKGIASPLALGETVSGAVGLTGAEKILKGAKESAYEALGATDYAPTSTSQRVVAGIGEGITDPLNAVGGGLMTKGVGMLAKGGKLATEGVSGGLAGGGAVFGEELGKAVGGDIGGMAGGLLGAVGAGTLPNRASNLVGAGSKLMSNAITSPEELTALGKDAAALQASDKIKGVFAGALKTNPDLAAEVMRNDEFKKILKSGLPSSATFGSNPYIDSVIVRLLETNPEFRGLYSKQYTEAKAALEARKKQLFGGSESAVTGLEQLGQENRVADIGKSVDKRLKTLDKQASQVARKLGSAEDSQELGNKMTTLLEAKESAARAAVAPMYEKALDYAKQNNVTMPSQSVQNIYDYVNDERNSDIFKQFPSLAREITSKLSPKQVEGSLDVVDGVLTRPVQNQFEGITPDVIDSLKRRLNSDIRKATGSQATVLRELKGLFEQGLDSISDTKFVNDYRNADAVYKQTVGVPFSASAIEMMDRAKFAEQVVPKVTLNASSLDQFLEAAGDKGVELASSAFRSDFVNKVVKDGVINKAAADKWLKQKAYFKDTNPDLYNELTEAVTKTNGLEIQKTRLSNEFKNAKAKQIFELNGKDTTQLFNQLKNPTEFSKFIKTYGNNKDAMDGARALALSKISKSGNPIQDLTDSELSGTYKKLFGKDMDRVVQVMEASERLRKSINPDDIRSPVSVVEADVAKRVAGISVPELLSQFRNPIVGAVRATANIASKVFQRLSDNAYDSEVAALFLNPEAARAVLLADRVNTMPDGVARQEAAKKLVEILKKGAAPLFDGMLSSTGKSIAVGYGSTPNEVQPEEGMTNE